MPSLLSACIKYLLVLYGHGDNFLLLSQYLHCKYLATTFMFHVYCLLFIGSGNTPGKRIGYTYGWRYVRDLAWQQVFLLYSPL
jgi:hypothetical protein